MSITDSRTQGPDEGPLGANAPQNAMANPEDGATPIMDSSAAVVIGIDDKSESNGNQFQFEDDGTEQTASSDSASEKRVKELQTNDICAICMDPILHLKELRCGHSFCAGCIHNSFDKYQPKCPSCGGLCNVIRGNQPAGMMLVAVHPESLPGYEDYQTGVIEYTIPNGIQNEKHPNPGRAYHGTYAKTYLPDNTEGKEVGGLLQMAFDAGLLFRIGQSMTNCLEDQVIWNDIHLKTRFTGEYGYPDPNYFSRVKEELKAKGIVPIPIEHLCNLL